MRQELAASPEGSRQGGPLERSSDDTIKAKVEAMQKVQTQMLVAQAKAIKGPLADLGAEEPVGERPRWRLHAALHDGRHGRAGWVARGGGAPSWLAAITSRARRSPVRVSSAPPVVLAGGAAFFVPASASSRSPPRRRRVAKDSGKSEYPASGSRFSTAGSGQPGGTEAPLCRMDPLAVPDGLPAGAARCHSPPRIPTLTGPRQILVSRRRGADSGGRVPPRASSLSSPFRALPI